MKFYNGEHSPITRKYTPLNSPVSVSNQIKSLAKRRKQIEHKSSFDVPHMSNKGQLTQFLRQTSKVHRTSTHVNAIASLFGPSMQKSLTNSQNKSKNLQKKKKGKKGQEESEESSSTSQSQSQILRDEKNIIYEECETHPSGKIDKYSLAEHPASLSTSDNRELLLSSGRTHDVIISTHGEEQKLTKRTGGSYPSSREFQPHSPRDKSDEESQPRISIIPESPVRTVQIVKSTFVKQQTIGINKKINPMRKQATLSKNGASENYGFKRSDYHEIKQALLEFPSVSEDKSCIIETSSKSSKSLVTDEDAKDEVIESEDLSALSLQRSSKLNAASVSNYSKMKVRDLDESASSQHSSNTSKADEEVEKLAELFMNKQKRESEHQEDTEKATEFASKLLKGWLGIGQIAGAGAIEQITATPTQSTPETNKKLVDQENVVKSKERKRAFYISKTSSREVQKLPSKLLNKADQIVSTNMKHLLDRVTQESNMKLSDGSTPKAKTPGKKSVTQKSSSMKVSKIQSPFVASNTQNSLSPSFPQKKRSSLCSKMSNKSLKKSRISVPKMVIEENDRSVTTLQSQRGAVGFLTHDVDHYNFKSKRTRDQNTTKTKAKTRRPHDPYKQFLSVEDVNYTSQSTSKEAVEKSPLDFPSPNFQQVKQNQRQVKINSKEDEIIHKEEQQRVQQQQQQQSTPEEDEKQIFESYLDKVMDTKKRQIKTQKKTTPAYYESGKNTPLDAVTGTISTFGMRQKKPEKNKGLRYSRNHSRSHITSMLKEVAQREPKLVQKVSNDANEDEFLALQSIDWQPSIVATSNIFSPIEVGIKANNNRASFNYTSLRATPDHQQYLSVTNNTAVTAQSYQQNTITSAQGEKEIFSSREFSNKLTIASDRHAVGRSLDFASLRHKLQNVANKQRNKSNAVKIQRCVSQLEDSLLDDMQTSQRLNEGDQQPIITTIFNTSIVNQNNNKSNKVNCITAVNSVRNSIIMSNNNTTTRCTPKLISANQSSIEKNTNQDGSKISAKQYIMANLQGRLNKVRRKRNNLYFSLTANPSVNNSLSPSRAETPLQQQSRVLRVD